MIYAIMGPTASGKSQYALDLARSLHGEIINADALQVYKEIELMSCAPSIEEKKLVPHHLYSFLNVNESYDIFQYQKHARECIEDILSRKKTPILVGGSGLYIRAALYDYSLKKEKNIPDLQPYLNFSDDELHYELEKLDPIEAKKIHPHNRVRVLRALSIYLSSGRTKTEQLPKNGPSLFYKDVKFILINRDRNVLYQRIEERLSNLFSGKQIEEQIFPIFDKFGTSCPAFKAIGVKEVIPWYEGKISKEDAFHQVLLDTRHYAKRQLTFFRHQFDNVEEIFL